MQVPIRVKFLAMCMLLVLVTAASISSTCDVIARRNKRRESRERIPGSRSKFE